MKNLVSVILILLQLNAYAQPLKIGDTLTDIKLPGIINFSSSEIKLSQFKAKLFLLDFWGLSCVSCIKAFPHMDSLQNEFRQDLQIIAITRDERNKVLRFFEKRKNIILPAIPFVTGDTILSQYFPQSFLPWHVWLDSNLVVRHITHAYNATKENIADFLKGKLTDFYTLDIEEIKKAEINVQYPFGLNSIPASTLYYTVLSNKIPGVSKSDVQATLSENKVQLAAVNRNIPNLFVFAHEENGKYKFNVPALIQIQIDSSRFIRPGEPKLRQAWDQKYIYDYYLMVGGEHADNIYGIMQKELQYHFKCKTYIQKKRVQHWVLKKRGRTKLKTQGGLPEDNLKVSSIKNPQYMAERRMMNIPFSQFSNRMAHMIELNTALPFKDKTRINENIDIQLTGSTMDSFSIKTLNDELRPYGLKLVEKIYKRPVLIIKNAE